MATFRFLFIAAAYCYMLSCFVPCYLIVLAQKDVSPLPEAYSVGTAVSDVNKQTKVSEVSSTIDEQDPRLGSCTYSELRAVELYFGTHQSLCPAYDCVVSLAQKFFESLNVYYPGLWLEGGDSSRLSSSASLLAACACRCQMMECEVNFIAARATTKCYEATIDYCNIQNSLFRSKCNEAATAYEQAVKMVAPDASWTSTCNGSCQSDGLDKYSSVFGTSHFSNPATVDSEADIDDSFADSGAPEIVDQGVSGNENRTESNQIELLEIHSGNLSSSQSKNLTSTFLLGWCIFITMLPY